MKIALLMPEPPEARTPDDHLVTLGLDALFRGAEVRAIFAPELVREPGLARLASPDLVVIAGEERWRKGAIESFPWTAEFFAALGRPVAALGLALPFAAREGLPDWAAGLVAWLGERSALSVSDPVTQALVAPIAGEIPLVGSAALFAELEPLRCAEKRTVFCPGALSSGPDAALGRACYEALLAHEPALFLADEASHLDWGAKPGVATLFAPRFPGHHARALGSAARVVSLRARPVLAAVANGIPAVYLGDDAGAKATLEALGVPCLDARGGKSTHDVVRHALRVLRDFPWDGVHRRVTAAKRRTADFVARLGVAPAPRKRPALVAVGEPRKRPAPLHLATISDGGTYLPYLLGFVENALSTSAGPVTFHVLALDERVEPALKSRYPKLSLHVYELSDLWSEEELPRVLLRSVGDRAYGSKPRLIERALEKAHAPVVYCDSDVYFLDDPAALAATVGSGNCSLFPHWNDVFSAARADGIFNAGMVVAAPGAEAMLEWWGRACLEACSIDGEEGVVGDQGYLDFVPSHFEGVRIYRRGDQNVARWNLNSLGVRFSRSFPARPELADGTPVRTYHAAFVDSLGLFEAKFAWDGLVSFFAGLVDPEKCPPRLFRYVTSQQRLHWLALSRAVALAERVGGAVGEKLKAPAAISALLTPAGRAGLALVARLSGAASRETQAGDPELDWWIRAQRALVLRRRGRGRGLASPPTSARSLPRGKSAAPTRKRRA